MERQTCVEGGTSKKTKVLDARCDRISSLPDSLLVYILDELSMQDVIKTSLISKRWRYIWPMVSCLDVKETWWRVKTDKATFIDGSIINHEGCKVKTFKLIWPRYKEQDSPRVDSWIRFAIRRNVEELKLEFCYGNHPLNEWHITPHYSVPGFLFSCRSLTTLALGFCDLSLPTSIELSSLKRLTLMRLYISDDAIKRLTCSCPLLEELILDACNCSEDLNIVIENQNVKYLKVSENFETCNFSCSIYAPSVVSLHFGFWLIRESYRLENLSSLRNVTFSDVVEYLDLDIDEDICAYKLALLLGAFQHVWCLSLCYVLTQLLAVWGLKNLEILPIKATVIHIEAEFTKYDIPGISYILKSSSNLKELTIHHKPANGNMLVFDHGFDFDGKGFWEAEDFDFSLVLQNLEVVSISFISAEVQTSSVDEILKNFEYQFEFLEFLLKNSKALQILNIHIKTKGQGNNYRVLFKITEKVTFLPRASPVAKVRIIRM